MKGEGKLWFLLLDRFCCWPRFCGLASAAAVFKGSRVEAGKGVAPARGKGSKGVHGLPIPRNKEISKGSTGKRADLGENKKNAGGFSPSLEA